MADVTQLLRAIDAGDARAADDLFPLVYRELSLLAERAMAGEKPDRTLCASDLVHEAYLRLIGPHDRLSFENRRHLYGAAAQAMRRILVDDARRRHRAKRGAGARRVELREVPVAESDDALLALDRALRELKSRDPVAAEVVDLHHFAGLTYEKTAEILQTTVYQVRRKWTFARAWLSEQLK